MSKIIQLFLNTNLVFLGLSLLFIGASSIQSQNFNQDWLKLVGGNNNDASLCVIQTSDGGFEYAVAADRCIGCGFCAGACPCGIWNMIENSPLE